MQSEILQFITNKEESHCFPTFYCILLIHYCLKKANLHVFTSQLLEMKVFDTETHFLDKKIVTQK